MNRVSRSLCAFTGLSLGSALGVVSGCAASRPSVMAEARMHADRGDPGRAVELLREHLRAHPTALPERRLLVRVLALTGDLGAAEREVERLVEQLGERDPTPWIELGHAYELGHRYDFAILYYDRAAEVAPRDARGPRAGGMRAARWGEAELAEPRLAEAARRDPADAEVWHALGLVRARLGDLAGARAAYRSGLAADPAALDNRLGLATVAVMERDPEAALEHYDALLAARPGYADGYLGKSWSLLLLGRLDEARAALDEASRAGADQRALERQRALLQHLERRKEVKRKR